MKIMNKWNGCPECGEKKYRNRFQMEDRHGLLLYNSRGSPKMECRYAPDDGTLFYKRQLYRCVGCGLVYDRRDGL